VAEKVADTTDAGLIRNISDTALISIFPESNGKQGKQPWSAVCLFAKQ
jgi:hypothetical protein